MNDEDRLLPWYEQSIAGLIPEAGNARKYETGGWRTYLPIRDIEKCIQCLRCFFICPDSSVLTEDGKVIEQFDLKHCKGCGICAKECPPKAQAIKMVYEADLGKGGE
ncbi:MAG: 4Fe-4S dicluster domain-containing protein [Planctomycetota bacterium]|jgi:2-oxoacid:acceptor oxidoreductase delta subunit (pyruvate/2-ketoisovalerate family)